MRPHLTRELSENERPSLLTHFLALDRESRRLRFGGFSGDESLRAYVKQIDFTRDAVFGVLDADLSVIGVAHLARGAEYAELGISVLPSHRGQGIAAALLERAHTYARNRNISVKNPDPEVLGKVWQIAQALRAKVQGDDGEIYREDGSFGRVN